MNTTIDKFKKIRLWAVAAVTVGAGLVAIGAARFAMQDVTSALEIVSITPDEGPDSGGQDVVISGLDFLEGRVNIVKVAAGSSHALAIDDQGNLYAWGDDDYGQIGDGELVAGHEDSSNAYSAVIAPIKLTGLEVEAPYVNELKDAHIVDIAASGTKSYAVDIEGKVYGWGGTSIGGGESTLNHQGGLLIGYVLAPVNLSELDTGLTYSNALVDEDAFVVGIATSGSNAFAYDIEGNLYAWGSDIAGQMGDGDSTVNHYDDGTGSGTSVMAPIKLTGLDLGANYTNQLDEEVFITKVVTKGLHHVLALDAEGNIYAWGSDSQGQIGDGANTLNHETLGTFDAVVAPVKLSGLSVTGGGQGNALKDATIVDIANGGNHSMAVDDQGNLYVWGHGGSGELGIGTCLPAEYHAPLLLSDFDLCGGATNPLRGIKIASVAAGYHNSAAIDNEGNLYVWGENSMGQLGAGEEIRDQGNVLAPLNLSTLDTGDQYVNYLRGKRIAMATGAGTHGFGLALTVDGDVYVWGDNSSRQIGDGNLTKNHEGGVSTGTVLAPINLSRTDTGSEFPNALYSEADAMTVLLGTALCTNVSVIDNTTLGCVTGAHPAGVVDVTISNGMNTVVLSKGYTYKLIGTPDTGVGR